MASADPTINSSPTLSSFTTLPSLLRRQGDACKYCVQTWPNGGSNPLINTMTQACNWPTPFFTTVCPDAGNVQHPTATHQKPETPTLSPTATSAPANSDSSSSSAVSRRNIALGVMGAITGCIVIAVVVWLVWFSWRMYKKYRARKNNSSTHNETELNNIQPLQGTGGAPNQGTGGAPNQGTGQGGGQ